MATDIRAKRLELLLTTVPQVSRMAILWDSSNPGMALHPSKRTNSRRATR
jgi:hypothetical protein